MDPDVQQTKYIFVTGGVVSGLGKGIAAASLGRILKERGLRVTLQKFDPYINVDPGTLNPFEHGEVFVTDDGAETDLDLGHYERFTGVSAHQADNVTSGRIYQQIIAKERRGDYLGATVQVVPHVTDAIKQFALADQDDHDFILCEIGGTVGDIEGLPFFEAMRSGRISDIRLEEQPDEARAVGVEAERIGALDVLRDVAREDQDEERRQQPADQDPVPVEHGQPDAEGDLDAAGRHHHTVGIHRHPARDLRLELFAGPEQVTEAGEHHRAGEREAYAECQLVGEPGWRCDSRARARRWRVGRSRTIGERRRAEPAERGPARTSRYGAGRP